MKILNTSFLRVEIEPEKSRLLARFCPYTTIASFFASLPVLYLNICSTNRIKRVSNMGRLHYKGGVSQTQNGLHLHSTQLSHYVIVTAQLSFNPFEIFAENPYKR